MQLEICTVYTSNGFLRDKMYPQKFPAGDG